MAVLTRFPARRRSRIRRRGIVYGIPVYHPDTRQVALGYVGQTRQRLAAREQQHHETQVWADTIAGRAYVIAHGVWDDDELDLAERRHIETLLPLYNVEYNLANPYRIPPWVAREQARRRGRVVVGGPPRARFRLAGPRRRGARWRLQAALYVLTVAAVAVACGVVANIAYLIR